MKILNLILGEVLKGTDTIRSALFSPNVSLCDYQAILSVVNYQAILTDTPSQC